MLRLTSEATISAWPWGPAGQSTTEQQPPFATPTVAPGPYPSTALAGRPASRSRSCRIVSCRAYRRYHQANPARTSSWLGFRPSGNMISATVRRYRSTSWTHTVTTFPNDRSPVNCLALVPNGCFDSGSRSPTAGFYRQHPSHRRRVSGCNRIAAASNIEPDSI